MDKNDKNINVLGTGYMVLFRFPKNDTYLGKERAGYCDKTSKTIVVALKDETNELDDYDVFLKQLIRHEVVHAFLFESGLHENFTHPGYGHEETIVDWIAAQYPKMLEVFKQLECI